MPEAPPFANQPAAAGERTSAPWPGLAADLRSRLAELLPDYMTPDRVVVLESFPLSPTGKVDRAALAAFVEGADAPAAGISRAAPRSGLEEKLAGLWQRLLDVDEVGIDDNFFDLGGNSFLVIKAQDRLQKTLGLEVAVTRFFEHPTIRQLAAHLDLNGKEKQEPAMDLDPFRARAAKRRRRRRRAL